MMVEYLIPEENFDEFVKSVGKFGKFTSINLSFEKKDIKKTIYGNITTNNKHDRDQLVKNKLMMILANNSYSTNEIIKKIRYTLSRKSLERKLTELAIQGFLKVEKIKKEKGGYKNMWCLK